MTEQFWSKVDRSGECWLWLGSKQTTGYGQFSPARRRNVRAHRWAYEQLVGPIPEGLELDHLCRNRGCVNPRHLEPVTHAENLRRGVSHWALKTHCPKGHPYDEANTYRQPGKPHRNCRICVDASRTRYVARKRAAA